MSLGFLNSIKTLAQQVSLYGDDNGNLLWLNGNKKWAFGYGGQDCLLANPNADSFLYGGEGNDFLYPNAGADFLHGGSGIDWVVYTYSPTGVFVDLQQGFGLHGHAAGDTLISIENVNGSAHDDTILGNGLGNQLSGGFSGNDVLYGNGGNDTLNGGANGGGFYGDRLNGGADADTFLFSKGSHSSFGNGVDVILDFDPTSGDAIRLDGNFGNPVTFSGEATNFSVPGSEVWYYKDIDPTYEEVTVVRAQLVDPEMNSVDYFDIMLVGHMDLTANDFVW